MEKFYDRREAGRMLSERLKSYANKPNVLVLALPRGGVPVAYEIAKALTIPLDVFLVRKLGVPEQAELAMGAITMNGTMVFNKVIIQDLGISKTMIEQVIQLEQQELQRREIMYRGERPLPQLVDKTIILVDDGVATGATIRVAIEALRQKSPAQIIAAVPVVALSVCHEITRLADKLVCLFKPTDLYSVGAWYRNFSQTTDTEVCELLERIDQE
jgi:putative phosphoribosyl transferase